MDKPDQASLDAIRLKATREIEVQAAAAASPGMEIGAAYKKWKEARGEKADQLYATGKPAAGDALKKTLARLGERPCTRPGCLGSQHLEGICSGCIEGQAGYKTKWTCRRCLHRDLSKEDLNQWLIKLSSA